MDLRKHLLRALLLCLLMAACVIGAALADESDDFIFDRNGDAWTVAAYRGSAAEVRVPDWHEGLPVTRIGPSAFEGNQTLTALILPSSITRIGAGAFRNCSRLTTISTYAAHSAHAWDEGEILTAPTCQQDGEIRYTCTVCRTTRDEVLSASGEYHVWGEGVVTTPATCKDEGVMTFACTVCQAEKTEPIPVTDEHAWGEGVVTQEPTETEDGVMTYTCTVCQATKTEPIPATGGGDDRMPGDVDGNGRINSRDALLTARHAAGYDVDIIVANADVDGNGRVNSRDALLIARYAAGYDVELTRYSRVIQQFLKFALINQRI